MSATCLAPVRPIDRAGELPRWFILLRGLERLLAVAAIIALAPVLAMLAILIWTLSRRPPIVAHLRVGQDGRRLWVLKFRTMWDRVESSPRRLALVERIIESPDSLKSHADPRVTSRLANFCRRYSIDELPQLIHVGLGHMSLVGPRPITAAELEEHYGPYAAEVLSIRPGLTGLWQIMGRNRLSYPQRLRLDLFLVRRYCLRLYVRILLRSIPRVLTGKDAW